MSATHKSYTLPDWCGGAEVVVVPRPEGRAQLEIGGERAELVAIPNTTHRMIVPHGWLTEVKPPLPPEPPAGSVVLDADRDAWQRESGRDRPWAAAVFRQGLGELARCDWAELNEKYGPLRRLVVDTAEGAATQAVLDAAQAWVAYVHNACSLPSVWADGHDFKLIAAVDAYNAAWEVEQP